MQDEREKFEEIKKKLGLEFSIFQLLKAKPNTKENGYLLLHQEADERSHTLTKINNDLTRKLKNMTKEEEESKLSVKKFEVKSNMQIVDLENKYSDL